MDEDCQALARGCQHCKIFEGAVVQAPICPIQAYMPLELVHVYFTSIETTMELNQPPSIKMSWSSQITSQDIRWHVSPRIRKQKLLCEFSVNDSSQYLVHQLNCSVTEAQTSPLHQLRSSVQHLAFRNAGLQHTTHNIMDK